MFRLLVPAACAWLAVAPAAHAEVQLSIRNGRVSLVAKEATVRQILAEWARVGKTKIVNAERIPGGPVTLEFKDVPESEALDVLLRTLSGYVAAPRLANLSAEASMYDAIVVMPTVAAAAPRTPSSSAPAPFTPPPAFNQPEDDDDAPGSPGAAQPRPVRPPIFSTFPSPRTNTNARPTLPIIRPGVVAQPPQEDPGDQPVQLPIVAPAPVAGPSGSSGPTGVSAPGMIAPTPPQPQPQPIQPQR